MVEVFWNNVLEIIFHINIRLIKKRYNFGKIKELENLQHYLKIEDDKLKREELLNQLITFFRNFGNQDGRGLTMVLNGKYGTGKSTLLNFITQKNEVDKEFNIVCYDAWENNYFDNPTIPLLYSISKLENENKIKELAKKIIKSISKIIIRALVNAHFVDLTPIVEGEDKDIFNKIDEFKKTVEKYKDVLTEVCNKKKTILLVDELDRCLPEYQIKVLECLYHFFDVPNLIVVIALDKEQLEESIGSKFGKCIDTYAYLSKFIQYNIDLPCESAYEYAKSLMGFYCNEEYEMDIKQIISAMFEAANLSVRDMQIIIQRLNLICKKRDDMKKRLNYFYYFPIAVSFVLILQYINKKLFDIYFSRQLEQQYNYDSSKIELKNSKFYEFITRAKEIDFNQILEAILNYPLGQAAMLAIINLFDDANKINTNDLCHYIKRDNINDVRSFLQEMKNDGWCFPKNVNSLIYDLSILA